MNVQFDKTKALNALLYVANRVQRKDFHKIFKIIYFSDRQHLAEWGRPITGDIYIAMEAGPVPSRMYDMLKIVRGDSYLPDQEGLGTFFRIDNWMYVTPLKDADFNKLSKTEMEAMDDSISKYGMLSYDEIKEKSHDVAWRSTARDFSIKWDDIAREAGLDTEEMECLNEFSQLEAQPIKACFEKFQNNEMKYCGILKDSDISLIQQKIISSGVLTADEISTFFS